MADSWTCGGEIERERDGERHVCEREDKGVQKRGMTEVEISVDQMMLFLLGCTLMA